MRLPRKLSGIFSKDTYDMICILLRREAHIYVLPSERILNKSSLKGKDE